MPNVEIVKTYVMSDILLKNNSLGVITSFAYTPRSKDLDGVGGISDTIVINEEECKSLYDGNIFKVLSVLRALESTYQYIQSIRKLSGYKIYTKYSILLCNNYYDSLLELKKDLKNIGGIILPTSLPLNSFNDILKKVHVELTTNIPKFTCTNNELSCKDYAEVILEESNHSDFLNAQTLYECIHIKENLTLKHEHLKINIFNLKLMDKDQNNTSPFEVYILNNVIQKEDNKVSEIFNIPMFITSKMSTKCTNVGSVACYIDDVAISQKLDIDNIHYGNLVYSDKGVTLTSKICELLSFLNAIDMIIYSIEYSYPISYSTNDKIRLIIHTDSKYLLKYANEILKLKKSNLSKCVELIKSSALDTSSTDDYDIYYTLWCVIREMAEEFIIEVKEYTEDTNLYYGLIQNETTLTLNNFEGKLLESKITNTPMDMKDMSFFFIVENTDISHHINNFTLHDKHKDYVKNNCDELIYYYLNSPFNISRYISYSIKDGIICIGAKIGL